VIDPTEAVDMVERDVSAALSDQLPGGEGFSLPEEFSAVRDDPLANGERTALVVPWSWQGFNEGLLELPRTGRPVTVRGVTIVTEDADGNPLCQRFPDWLTAISEAGIIISTRPIVDIREGYSEDDLREIPGMGDALDEIDRARSEPSL
jgi:hypothetical protein